MTSSAGLPMEKLLHYVWLHRLLPAAGLVTDEGEPVDVLSPGLPNRNAGPDFTGAKVRIGSTLWVGDVELHRRSSDWQHHGHDSDPAYNHVVLHVVARRDADAFTAQGERVPQAELPVPPALLAGYEALLAAPACPPCRSAATHVPAAEAHAWLTALAVERLEEKTARVDRLLALTGGDWEYTFFVMLARAFGFGVNGEAFEAWALSLPPAAIGKHRDQLFQVEAFFLGQAGLLAPEAVGEERRDAYWQRLAGEYAFLRRKFGLVPLSATRWKFLRLRPQNFPHVRLAQLAALYHGGRARLSAVLDARSAADVRRLFATSATGYWETHYTFGRESAPRHKTLQGASLDGLLINAAAPLLFAYGRRHDDEGRCERATEWLEETPPESNHITRAWTEAGLPPRSAAESQALVRLQQAYCDRRDCLRCRFGAAFLKRAGRPAQPDTTAGSAAGASLPPDPDKP